MQQLCLNEDIGQLPRNSLSIAELNEGKIT